MTFPSIKTTALALALACASAAQAAAPRVTASIDSTQVEMGSSATITIDITDPQKAGHLVDLPEDDTKTREFDLYDVKGDTFPGGYQYKVAIRAFVPGDYTLEPFHYVVGTDTFASQHLSLKVLPVDLDTLTTINPMMSVTNEPRRWYDYIPDYAVWIALGAALLALIIILIVRYRRTGAIIVRQPKPVDPYEEAMKQLRTLRERRLAESGREKEFYTSLVDILRVYLERRFGINAMEMSTTQILDSLNHNDETRGNHQRIKQILDLADFVKFANIRPLPDDNIKTYNNVVEFIEDTKPRPAEPDGAKDTSKDKA